MEERAVLLNEVGLKCLFIGIVCEQLERAGFTGDAFKLARSLDMSFEEISPRNLEAWGQLISDELEEFKAENPSEFEIKH